MPRIKDNERRYRNILTALAKYVIKHDDSQLDSFLIGYAGLEWEAVKVGITQLHCDLCCCAFEIDKMVHITRDDGASKVVCEVCAVDLDTKQFTKESLAGV